MPVKGVQRSFAREMCPGRERLERGRSPGRVARKRRAVSVPKVNSVHFQWLHKQRTLEGGSSGWWMAHTNGTLTFFQLSSFTFFILFKTKKTHSVPHFISAFLRFTEF